MISFQKDYTFGELVSLIEVGLEKMCPLDSLLVPTSYLCPGPTPAGVHRPCVGEA